MHIPRFTRPPPPPIARRMAISIRPAVPADLPVLHALIERAYRGATARAGWTHEADLLRGPRTTQADLAAIIADPASAMLIAVEDSSAGAIGGAIIACVQVSDKGGIGYLGQLAVEPARQTGGLGRTMITAAEDRARNLGAARMEMTVIGDRTELIAYYQRRGYAATGEIRPFPWEMPASGMPLHLVVMERALGE